MRENRAADVTLTWRDSFAPALRHLPHPNLDSKMATQITIDDDAAIERFAETFHPAVQSAHLNFLLGAGASCPAIPAAGSVEQAISALLDEGRDDEADKAKVNFLRTFVAPTAQLLEDEITDRRTNECLQNYVGFLAAIDAILAGRRTSLLPRQAAIFTTNYDLFVERASQSHRALVLNDGFSRSGLPSTRSEYHSEKLFDATYHTAQHYDYTVEVPTINLVKLHGSLSWSKASGRVFFELADLRALEKLRLEDREAVGEFLSSLGIIMPTREKFRDTVLDRTHYDLLRIFANTLERRNTILCSFGFSFIDAHVSDIVLRALRNPTLQLVVCCYTSADADQAMDRFEAFRNVTVLVGGSAGNLDFSRLNKMLSTVPPKKTSGRNGA